MMGAPIATPTHTTCDPWLWFEITPDDVLEGVRGSREQCAVAQALRRLGYDGPHVTGHGLFAVRLGTHYAIYQLDERGCNAIEAFDLKRPLEDVIGPVIATRLSTAVMPLKVPAVLLFGTELLERA